MNLRAVACRHTLPEGAYLGSCLRCGISVRSLRRPNRARVDHAWAPRTWLHRKPWLLLRGREFWLYKRLDLIGSMIFVCCRCGCHFVGSACPSGRCRARREVTP